MTGVTVNAEAGKLLFTWVYPPPRPCFQLAKRSLAHTLQHTRPINKRSKFAYDSEISIHPFSVVAHPYQGHGWLETIPAYIGREPDYILDKFDKK